MYYDIYVLCSIKLLLCRVVCYGTLSVLHVKKILVHRTRIDMLLLFFFLVALSCCRKTPETQMKFTKTEREPEPRAPIIPYRICTRTPISCPAPPKSPRRHPLRHRQPDPGGGRHRLGLRRRRLHPQRRPLLCRLHGRHPVGCHFRGVGESERTIITRPSLKGTNVSIPLLSHLDLSIPTFCSQRPLWNGLVL